MKSFVTSQILTNCGEVFMASGSSSLSAACRRMPLMPRLSMCEPRGRRAAISGTYPCAPGWLLPTPTASEAPSATYVIGLLKSVALTVAVIPAVAVALSAEGLPVLAALLQAVKSSAKTPKSSKRRYMCMLDLLRQRKEKLKNLFIKPASNLRTTSFFIGPYCIIVPDLMSCGRWAEYLPGCSLLDVSQAKLV